MILRFSFSFFALVLLIPGGHLQDVSYEKGFQYEYFYKSDTEIMGMDNMTTEMEVTVTPITSDVSGQIIQLQLLSVQQFSEIHQDRSVLAKDTFDKLLYFRLNSSGTVQDIFSSPSEDEDILVLKTAILAALSYHRQTSELSTWTYSVGEVDHHGLNKHHYQGEQTTDGQTTLKRRHQARGLLWRDHGRVIKVRANGEIQQVDDEEEILVHEDDKETFVATAEAGSGSAHPALAEAKRVRLRSISKLVLREKRPIHRIPHVKSDVLQKMKLSGLALTDTNWRKDLPASEVGPKVQKLLTCTNKYPISDRRRVDCVTEMMQLVYHLRPAELTRWGHNALSRKCSPQDGDCVKGRSTLINVIGQVKSPESQKLIVRDVIMKEPTEDDLKRAIFHLSCQENPIDETIDILEELCFGKNYQLHGTHGMEANQRRSCLALGSVLSHHPASDRTNQIVKQFHAWLEKDLDKVDSLVDTGYHDLRENVERSNYISTKHVLLEVLGNAAHPQSKPYLLRFAVPNHGHAGWRHGALSGLKHYHDAEAATAIMNSTLNDPHYNVRVYALEQYKKHPKAFELHQDDEVLLAGHNVSTGAYHKLSKRAAKGPLCNLLAKLTLDKEYRLPGIDWQKDVGNSMFGANFGIKMVNRMHLHLSPVSGFFEVEAVNSAWIKAHVKLIVRLKQDLIRAEMCYRGDIRFWNMSFVKDWATEEMSEVTKDLDKHLDGYADLLIDGVNKFNQLLGEYNIPELGLFDLDTSSPRALVNSIKEGIETAKGKDWQEWAIELALNQLEQLGLDPETFRGMLKNSEEWAKERFIQMMETYFEDEWKQITDAVKIVQDILQKDLGEIDFPLGIMDQVLEGKTLRDLIDDPHKFGEEVVDGVKALMGDYVKERQDGLMGQINQIIEATREFPNKLNELRDEIQSFKDDLLDIEGLDWAQDVIKVVQRVRYFIEDDASSILDFFQIIIDETGITLPYLSQLIESANKFIENASRSLMMSPTQAMTDIMRALRQMKMSIAAFANLKEKLVEFQRDVSGKLSTAFMQLGQEYEDMKSDIEVTLKKLKAIATIQSFKSGPTLSRSHGFERGIAEKLSMTVKESESVNKAIKDLESIRDKVFALNYLGDEYLDGFDRVMGSMELAKERYEELKKSAQESKEFIHEVFGIKYHPAFPEKTRDECDEECECGIYPSYMYGRVGTQLMIDVGEPIVCPVDGYVIVSTEHPEEVIVRPVDEDLDTYEIVITHILPEDALTDDLDEEEKKIGVMLESGTVIGYATKSPCKPNFIFVAQRENTRDRDEPLTTVKPPEEKPECGSSRMPSGGYYAPVDDYQDTPFPMPKWVTHCQHAKYVNVLATFDLQNFAERFADIMQNLDRVIVDIGKKLAVKIPSALPKWPDILDPNAILKMTAKIEKKIKKFPRKIERFLETKLFDVNYKWIDGLKIPEISFPDLNLKFPDIKDFLNINMMKVSEMMDFLKGIDLDFKADQLLELATKLKFNLGQKIWDNPFKFNPSKVRAKLAEWGTKLGGLNLDDLNLKFFEKLKGCGNGLVVGEGSICDSDNSCIQIFCSLKAKFSHFIERLDFFFEHDDCTRDIWIGINGHLFNISYKDLKNKTIEEEFDYQNKASVVLKAHLELNEKGDQIKFSASLKACLKKGISTCSPPIDIMKEYELNVQIEIEDCDPNSPPPTPTDDTVEIGDILDMTMQDFTFALDRSGENRSDIFQLMDELRTTAVQTLLEKTGLRSSIDGNEIYNPQDIEANDERKKLAEFDITFFRLPVKIPVPPLVFKVEIGAGGVIGLNFGSNVKVLSSRVEVTLDPWIAGKAWGDGSATCAGVGGGVRLSGYLLETHFPFTMIYEYEEYPIKITKKLDVELIPLRCKFEGYMQMTKFIKIKFTIFNWAADKLSWNIFTKHQYIDDTTPPRFIGDVPPSDGVQKRSVAKEKCHVEQVIGRHPTDAAFLLEAPFIDEESKLDLQYAIGTYPGGTNVLDWHDMEGYSMLNTVQLKMTGVPLHFTVKAKNTQALETILQCSIVTYDITLPTGRMEANHIKTSHPHKLSSSLIIMDDSPLVEEQFVAVGVGEHYYGHSLVDWHHFELEKNPINKEATGPLEHFASGRVGKLTTTPFQVSKAKHDYDCAKECLDYWGEKCISFDYEYETENCELQSFIEGPGVHRRVSNSYHNYERLGSGHSSWFQFDQLPLIHGEVYYINARITNNIAYENYLTSALGITVDFTSPEPGPVGEASLDILKHDGCSASFNHPDRCIDVTYQPNHRIIIDGPGGETVFNGNWPKRDMLYTISNHYLCGNWDGFHDNETGLWAYTWAAGTRACDSDTVEYEDPHSHLADQSYWNHQGYKSDLVLNPGGYFVTVQALNDVVYGGALVTSVCHHNHLIIDLTPPILHIVEDVFFDEEFDIMAIYYQAYDLESGIMRADFGLGETQHDVFVRSYSRHDPEHDGFEMVTVDDVDLPEGIPIWIRVRPVNNVELLTAGHGKQPIMVDTTPPIAGDVLDGDQLYDLKYQPYDHRMCAQWLGFYDPESGIQSYYWAIGTAENETDIMDWKFYDSHTKSGCVSVNLTHAVQYYNHIKVFNHALNARSTNKTSDGVLVDMTDPVAGVVNDGPTKPIDMEYSSKPASVYAYWTGFYDPESGIDKFDITVDVNSETVKSKEQKGFQTEMADHTFHLQHYDFVEVTVEATDGATRTNMSKSNGFRIDLTPPKMHFLQDSEHGYKYIMDNDKMYGTWQFSDDESFIAEYRVRIFQFQGGNKNRFWPKDKDYQIYDPHEDDDNIVETHISGLKMQNGLKYSIEVIALNKADLSTKHESHGVIVDTTPPVMKNVYVGFYGADEFLNDDDEVILADPELIHASWVGFDHESGIIDFKVAVGKTPGDSSVTHGFISYGTGTSGYIRDILLNVTAETGDVYYVSVQAMNGAGAVSAVVSSRPIHVYGANKPGTVSDGRKTEEDDTYQQDTTSVAITFSGFESPACGIRSYEWAVGSEPGWSDVLPYSSVGVVLLNETHGQAQSHLELHHQQAMYASVRALTGHACHEDIIDASSDGTTVDVEEPLIVILNLGLLGMENQTADVLKTLGSTDPVYQSQYDSIDLRWNATDEVSDIANITWMAGSLPLLDDIHEETTTLDNQIPLTSIIMEHGETVMFTIQAEDFAGNKRFAVTPPLTIDTSPPDISGLNCNKYLSSAKSEISCQWLTSLDPESPIINIQIGVGTDQLLDDLVPFQKLTIKDKAWTYLFDDKFFNTFDNDTVFVSLLAENKVSLESSELAQFVVDRSPPEVGSVAITTSESPVDYVTGPIVCQRSSTTMKIDYYGFDDPESGILKYEVAVGSYEGGTDLRGYTETMEGSISFDKLAMIPGQQAFATVRAVNRAGLVSGISTSSVYISPNPQVTVNDGLEDVDVDFQHDISSISGKVFMSQHCPIMYGEWTIHDLEGNVIMEKTEFKQDRFANDELLLVNMKTYYVEVEFMDAMNRTFRGRSNGVTIYIQPPEPGAVRDGPHIGEDRNYQQSSDTLWVNWDDFGSDEPGRRIDHYEVAIGDNPAYSTSRSNVHYFVNVGLEKNYTFVFLRLQDKTVKYYATVRAVAENGGSTEASSNGVRVGYKPGMLSGNIEMTQYSNSSSVLSLSWNGFWSDFRILHYHWGISSTPFTETNVTVLCRDYLPEIKNHFDVLSLVDVKENTFSTRRLLKLEHNHMYYVTVIAEDEPGQCVASEYESVFVDLTPPEIGEISISGISKQVQYLLNPEELEISWSGFHDPESGIADFYIQLYEGDDCNSGDISNDHFKPISGLIDVSNQTTAHLYEFLFEEARPYKIFMTIRNQAGSESFTWSKPIFVDTSAAVKGTVKDGHDWKSSALFQPSTDKMQATIAVSPLGTGVFCKTQKDLLQPDVFKNEWTILNEVDVLVTGPFGVKKKVLEYQDWNIVYHEYENDDAEDLHEVDVTFHRNISLSNMEGGAMLSNNITLYEGKFTMKLKGAPGENTILSITMSTGFLDDYISFEMVNYTEPLDNDDFIKQADSIELDWDPQIDPNATEAPFMTTEEPPIIETNNTDSTIPKKLRDIYDTDGFGVHFIGRSFGSSEQVWFILVWVRHERDIVEEWVMLDFDITDDTHEYDFVLEKDETTEDLLWNIMIYIDGEFATEISGVELPPVYSVKARNWNYDNVINEIVDPFNPFKVKSVIQTLKVPLPQNKMCHYGQAFYDMESGVEQVYVGIGNLSDHSANILPFQHVAELCHSCIYRCDIYKCQQNCTIQNELIDGYYFLNLEVDDLDLFPGDHKPLITDEGRNLWNSDRFNFDDEFDDETNQTYFDSIRYYFLVKVVNEAGMVTFANSPGIRIDPTPPQPLHVIAVDPEFDMALVATHQGHTNSLAAWWEFDEPESYITNYKVAVGTKPNGTEILDWTDMGLEADLLIHDLNLVNLMTYYFTIEATNAAGLKTIAHTDGIQVKIGSPDVSNATVSLPYDEKIIDGEDEILLIGRQDEIEVGIGGELPDDAVFIEWAIGLSENDTFIMRSIAVERPSAYKMQIKEGYFYYNDEKTEWSFLESGIRTIAESNATDDLDINDPGKLLLEPGLCIYHHVNAMNWAHQKTHIPIPPTCIKRNNDQLIDIKGKHFDVSFSSGDTKGNIIGDGKYSNLLIGTLTPSDLDLKYETSGNITYSPALINPQDTKNLTSRLLHHRIVDATDRSIFIAPVTKAVVEGPLEITLSFDGISIQPGLPPGIAYWNPASVRWHHIMESCEKEEVVDFTKKTVTGWFCGQTTDEDALEIKQTQFALLLIDSNFYNEPPKLVTKHIEGLHNVPTVKRLLYEDYENDEVVFSIIEYPEHGNATLTNDGILEYNPERWFFGNDKLEIQLVEVGLPPVIVPNIVKETVQITIIEPAIAPNMYLESEHLLEDDYTVVELRTGQQSLGFEANTTVKDIGYVYLCDINQNDIINFIYTNVDSNVTYEFQEVLEKQPLLDDNEMQNLCLDSNARVFKVRANSSEDYHGRDELIIIGHDNTVLYSQPLILEMNIMISPCVHGHCVGGADDPDCKSTDRVWSYEMYGCSCDQGYKGAYCTQSHLLAWEIVMIVAGVVSMSVFAVMAVVNKRRKRKIVPVLEQEVEEEVSEYETDTESEEEEDSGAITRRDVELELPDGEAHIRYKDQFKKEAVNQWFQMNDMGVEGPMTEIEI